MTVLSKVILTDKPKGITSRKWDDAVQKALHLTKTGHVGTLDPMATGLQIILSGRATRLLQYFIDGTKRYEAEVTFGLSTDTWDTEGQTVKELATFTMPDLKTIENTLDTFRGPITQTPPPHSAIKVEGKPMYYWTRKGIHKLAPPREVEVYSIDNTTVSNNTVSFSISCSKGTYIRSIANELGQKLGLPSHLSALRRTEIGPFSTASIDSTIEIPHVLLSPFEALSLLYPTVEVPDPLVPAITNGRTPDIPELLTLPDTTLFLLHTSDTLLAVCERTTTAPTGYKLRTVYPAQ